MQKHNLISVLIPTISFVIVILAFLFVKPKVTGLTIYEREGEPLVDADVTLATKVGEVIPTNAIIEVILDDKKDSMSLYDYIMKTEGEYDIIQGELPDFGFYGAGFSGDHSYSLPLSTFDIDRNIGKGEHTFIIRIKYKQYILYEKENNIMVS